MNGGPTKMAAPKTSSTFYNHVEEIITSDNWEEDLFVKGCIEEIQVSVQKLYATSKTPERVVDRKSVV